MIWFYIYIHLTIKKRSNLFKKWIKAGIHSLRVDELKTAEYYYWSKYIQVMSKPNIRFVYRTQEQEIRSVKSIPKLATNHPSTNEVYMNLANRENEINRNINIRERNNYRNPQNFQQQITEVPSVEVISKPTSPKFIQTRAKSPENIIEQMFTGQLKTSKVQRNQSPRPALNIEQADESQLIKKPAAKRQPVKEIQASIPDGQIVLKAPSFKYVPKQEGELNSGNRKQYVRAQRAQKYLYNGIPQKNEDDFIGCFGCFEKKPKTYKVSHK